MKILLTGGSGLLGKELLKINKEMLAPSHSELDVTSASDIDFFFSKWKPDVVIHAAAIIDNRVLEKTPGKAIDTNIIGTAHLAMICEKRGVRLVYISTDYVYWDGSHG